MEIPRDRRGAQGAAQLKRDLTIRGLADPSATERTCPARARTGIALTAFGFLMAKLDLLLPLPAAAAAPASPMDDLVGPVGRDDGLALAALGIAVVIIAGVRLVRIRSLLDDTEEHRSSYAQFGVAFSAVLALVVASTCVYLALA